MLEAEIAAKRLPSGELLLQGLRLSAAPGEIVALLGASGTGKTSTLRIVLGLDQAFEGCVRNAARRVGAMFQEPRLLPWLTIGDNIRLVIPRDMPMPDIGRLLADIGLPASENLYPRQISLGMARRAAFARALAIAPDLLILDEPFASLDAGTSGLIAAQLERLKHAGGAAVIAMHDVDRAVTLATRIVVLAGRPATVAWQADIPVDADAGVRADLMARFPFLSDAAKHPADDGLPREPREG
jgi:NitT/TauT family transport system ATP-binding protein